MRGGVEAFPCWIRAALADYGVPFTPVADAKRDRKVVLSGQAGGAGGPDGRGGRGRRLPHGKAGGLTSGPQAFAAARDFAER